MTRSNEHAALLGRLNAGTLTWRGPAVMLFARSACAVGAQALIAAIFALRSSPTPWLDAASWLPVYGTLIDAGCLALLWRLTRREGIGLLDLVGFERAHLVRDALLGLALIPVNLVFVLGGVFAVGWLVYGTVTPSAKRNPLGSTRMEYRRHGGWRRACCRIRVDPDQCCPERQPLECKSLRRAFRRVSQ